MNINISKPVQKVADQNRAIYEYLHQNPQIGFEETEAQAIIIREAENLGLEYEIVAKTGVLVSISGKTDTKGAVSAIRADMDALPIQEQTDLPYKSINDGYMHACGHDLHTTAALTAMRVLAEDNDFDGTAKILFQPAEEGLGGGNEVASSGILERHKVQRLFAMHIWPQKPLGTVELHNGGVMASNCTFEIQIHGQGGHAALARQNHLKTAADLMLSLSEEFETLNKTLAKKYPDEVFTIQPSNYHTGEQGALNVIQPYAYIGGTVRGYDQNLLHDAKTMLLQAVAKAGEPADYKTEFDFSVVTPPTINTKPEFTLTTEIFNDIVGAENVDTAPTAKPTSEDFGFYGSLKKPDGTPMGLMFALIGQNDEDHPCDEARPYDLHHPKMKSNPKAIAIGAQYFVDAIKRSMPLNDPS